MSSLREYFTFHLSKYPVGENWQKWGLLLALPLQLFRVIYRWVRGERMILEYFWHAPLIEIETDTKWRQCNSHSIKIL